MDINLELYKVFYYVATTLSFSEASRQLFISQSAVSQSIKTLEKKLGHTLFIRSTKKVLLTPEGELRIFPQISPVLPGCPDQSHQQHFDRLCRTSGKRSGRPDRMQLAEFPSRKPHESQSIKRFPRCVRR